MLRRAWNLRDMHDAEQLEDAGWQKKESLGSVLAQIAVVGAILAFAVFFAYQRGVDRQVSTAAIERARELLRLDTPKDLEAALAAVQPALTSSLRGGDAHAVAARIHAELGVVHGNAAARTQAEVHLAEARKAESEVEELASAEALLTVAAGKPAEAIQQLEGLTQKGLRRLDLEYVLARAHLAAGRPDHALTTLNRAAEVAAREPRIHSLRADLLLEAGEAKDAVSSYRRALAGNAQHPGARLGLAIAQTRISGDASGLESAVAALRAEGELTLVMEQRAADAKIAGTTAIATDAP